MDDLFEAVLQNQILVERLKTTYRAEWDQLLLEYRAIIQDELNSEEDELSELSLVTLLILLGRVRTRLTAATSIFLDRFTDELLRFSITQADARASILQLEAELTLARDAVRGKDLENFLRTSPLLIDGTYRGTSLPDAMRRWTSTGIESLVGGINANAHEGKTNTEIKRAIIGSSSQLWKDGYLESVRRSYHALSNTSLQFAVGVADGLVDDVAGIEGILWKAMLEGNVCARCRGLDGHIFKISQRIRPPAHVSCRCIGVPVLAGVRKMAPDLPDTYYDWLKTKPREYIEQVIGIKRTALFLDSGMTVDRFRELQIDKNFMPITLEELRKRIPRIYDIAVP